MPDYAYNPGDLTNFQTGVTEALARCGAKSIFVSSPGDRGELALNDVASLQAAINAPDVKNYAAQAVLLVSVKNFLMSKYHPLTISYQAQLLDTTAHKIDWQGNITFTQGLDRYTVLGRDIVAKLIADKMLYPCG